MIDFAAPSPCGTALPAVPNLTKGSRKDSVPLEAANLHEEAWMFRVIIIICFLCCSHTWAGVVNLRCEYLTDPLGIDVEKPRLSWVIEDRGRKTEVRGQKQTAYQVLVASSEKLLRKSKGDLWDSGKVASDQSIQVEYQGIPLESRMYCHWKVRVWIASGDDKKGKATEWSTPAFWSMGLPKPEDWQAKWIKPPGKETSPRLRKEFTLAAAPARAMAFVNAKGYYELYVNGMKVGDDVLSPAVAVYRKRSLYNTYDISKFLHAGTNCVGVWLGMGWHWWPAPIARVQLDMSVGGQRVVVGTDPTWTFMPSTHTEYEWGWNGNGHETIDARREIAGWSEAGCTEGKWLPVEEFAEPSGVATAQSCPPNRVTKVIPLKACTALGPNTWELDFGTNLTGWLRLRLPKMESGQRVMMRFADKRFQTPEGDDTPAGHVKTEPIAPLKIDTPQGPACYQTHGQEADFTSAGKPGEQYCPKFNYYGFRYVIVEGLPAKPAPGDAEALMIESDLEPAGSFECSNDLFNRIQQVNMWTIRCLSLGGYMVDCPHRERLGYGGDGQTSIDTQIMNRGAAAFYAKWAVDWLDELFATTGRSAQFAPRGIRLVNNVPTPDDCCYLPWGGMVCVLPWKAYLYCGDRRLLERAYEPMRRYPTVYLESLYPDGVHRQGGEGAADWVPPGRGMDGGATVPGNELFINCYRVYLLGLLAKSADALGRTDEAQRHRTRINELRTLIHSTYYNANDKLYDSDAQVSQSLPLMTGIVPDSLCGTVQKKLEEIILAKNKGHLDTGMLGTYFLFQYLQEAGRNDLAYTIANQKDYPGWGYMLSQGATTFWEQWNGHWSQIHACYANPGGWFYQGLAGIRPDETGPGFKKIIIKPAVVGDLTWVKCGYESIHGRIVSNWKREAGKLTMDVTIPVNTTATVYVPAKAAEGVAENGKPTDKVEGVKFLRMQDSAAVHAVGSGTYRFQSTLP
jgi:alpha-L-rhamnosidase